MKENMSSAFDGLKGLAENAHIKEKLGDIGDKIKDAVSDIDIQDVVADVGEKYKEGGVKAAIHEVGEKFKDVAGHASAAVQESLRDNPGAAIDAADNDEVNPSLVSDRTKVINNNPRNNETK